MAAAPLYLGLDSSTQGVKATVVDGATAAVVHRAAVNYDADLPHFRTRGGMHASGPQGAVVTSPTGMWLEALDLLFARLAGDEASGTSTSGAPFRLRDVAAVSGSGQQHGSVYWRTGAARMLRELDPAVPLGNQLADAFARRDSPIWADSSTGAECAALEAACGGAAALSAATGSRAYERFTGNQIAKIAARERASCFDRCERISLVSSFMCSLLLGAYAPVDTSDGSGTNLNHLTAPGPAGDGTAWFAPALAACSGGAGGDALAAKLGAAGMVPAHTTLGGLCNYFVYRYGMSPACRVVAWSGDNPCSLAGLGLQQAGDVAVSMGTSDTMFTMMANATPGADGHVLRNPVDPASFMGMLCFKNGSLAREDVSNRLCGGDWGKFAQLLGERAPGNAGAVGFYYTSPEITPTTGAQGGVQRYDAADTPVDAFDDPAAEVRAVLEGKFLAMRLFGEGIGMETASVRRIIATGGASNNPAILQVLADVFGVPVLTLAQSDSASLGAAFRALHGHACEQAGAFVPFPEALPAGALAYTEAARPAEGACAVYGKMLPRFRRLQEAYVKSLLG